MNNFDKEQNKKKTQPLDVGEAIGSSRKYLLGGVCASVIAFMVLVGYGFYHSKNQSDNGSNSDTTIASAPALKNDTFAPVGKTEADRRATLNNELAEDAKKNGESHVSQTVIAEKYNVGDPRDPLEKEKKTEELQKSQEETQPKVIEKIVYRDPPLLEPNFDDNSISKINSQIVFAQKPQESHFVSMAFQKPEPIKNENSTNNTNTQSNFNHNASLGRLENLNNQENIAAKPGDIFYGSLWIGFNSDDPRGAPVYATIFDNRPDGTTGALHGARLEGRVTYSDRNAALQFDKIIFENGKIVPVTALAVDENTARLGIAEKVDNHTFQRYSALLLSSLIEGVGDAANTMLVNNRTVTYLPEMDTITSSSKDNDEWAKAGLAALRPVGNALSSASRKGFDRPATISANRNHRIGIVFTSLVKL